MNSPKKILLHCSFEHIPTKRLYNFVASYLNERGFHAKFLTSLREVNIDDFDFIISHDILKFGIRESGSVKIFCGRWIPRPYSLNLLKQSRVPVMNWGLAANKAEVLNLFDLWKTETILLKKSYTWAGNGVCAFHRSNVDSLSWEPDEDIFCENLSKNKEENYIYKAEIFNGKVVISWKSRCSNKLSSSTGIITNLKSSRRKRMLYKFPLLEIWRIKKASRDLTKLGYGYSAIEFMKDGDGKFKAIELDIGYVGTWWTSQFDFVKYRYAQAIHRLLQGQFSWF